jgi:hypothetical protein
MKNKQLLYMGVAIVVLLLIYFFMQRTSVPVAEFENLYNIDTSKVTEATLYDDGNTVTVVRDGSEWNVINPFEYKANPRFGQMLLEKLAGMRVESVVTSKEERWGEFGLAEDPTRVSIKEGNKEHVFFVGKTADGYRQTYMRRDGSKEVLLVKGSYGVVFTRKPENWKDKTILKLDQHNIKGVGTDDYHIYRNTDKDDTWFIDAKGADTRTCDYGEVKRVLGAVSNLRTSDFPAEDAYAKVKWNKPKHTLTIDLFDGGVKKVQFFKDPANDSFFFVKLEGNDVIFKVYPGTTNQIFKKAEELLPKEG